jgi:hypothetical protein
VATVIRRLVVPVICVLSLGLALGVSSANAGAAKSTRHARTHATRHWVVLDPSNGREVASGTGRLPSRVIVMDPRTGRVIWSSF